MQNENTEVQPQQLPVTEHVGKGASLHFGITVKMHLHGIGHDQVEDSDTDQRKHALEIVGPPEIEARVQDAAEVHRYTGVAPSVALHIPWDKTDDWSALKKSAADLGLEIGAINP